MATPTPTPDPRRSSVAVRFPGATKFDEGELRSAIAEQIEIIEQQGLSRALADDAAFFLGIFYRKHGYSQVDVQESIAGPRGLVLAVREGPLTELGHVEFRGVNGLSEATLRDYIIGVTRERFPREKTLPYVESDVNTGVDRIRGLYASEGFLDAEIEPPEITLTRDKRRADVLVSVNEGTRYRFGKVGITGDIVFYPHTELLKQLEPFTQKPYTPQQVTNMQRAVVYYYKVRGYFNPKVEVESDRTKAVDGAVPVTFRVDSGNVYRFDGVSQVGLDRLMPSFLPRRFVSLKGKFYNPQLLDEKFREMMRTGLFRQLRIEPRPLPDNTIELHMNMEEAKSKEIGFSVGYGTFEGIILGLSAGDRNLMGTGRPLTASVNFAQQFARGEILYVDPWYLDSEYSLRLRVYGLTQSFEGYSKVETGFRGELGRKLTKQLELSAFMQTRNVEIEPTGIDPLLIGPTSYVTQTAGLSATLDLRDSPINPTRGLVANTTVDFTTASTSQFLRGTTRFSYYLPIKRTLLAFGVRGGWIYPLSGEGTLQDIPIDERFFNGGSRSVRSFQERRLGPKDRNAYPIGGLTFSTLNLEYQFPIWGELLGAVFVDAGSVGMDAGSLGQLRYGVGAGLRYRSPVGPLRLDYAVNPSPKEDEESAAFHFSFGVAF